MRIATLKKPERCTVTGDMNKSTQAMTLASLAFVGLIRSSRIQGVCCLLKDGTLLTNLHLICDIEKAYKSGLSPRKFYDSTQDIHIYFLKGLEVYQYTVYGVIHDGITVLETAGSQAQSFDYARLRLNGNPLQELGGGLELDHINHYGSATDTTPNNILGISAPEFIYDSAYNYFSSSREILIGGSDFSSTFYTLPQTSNLVTRPGHSGLAILPLSYPYNLPNKTLYAIHSGRSHSLGQEGVKIFEYLQQPKNLLSTLQNIPPVQIWAPPRSEVEVPIYSYTPFSPIREQHFDPSVVQMWGNPARTNNSFFLPNDFEYEALKRNPNINFAEIANFLDNLMRAIENENKVVIDKRFNKKKEKPVIPIPPSLKKQVIDGHFNTKHGSKSGGSASKFFELMGGEDDPILNALASCVTEIAVVNYLEHRDEYIDLYLGQQNYWGEIERNPSLYEKFKKEAEERIPATMTFIVNVGFNIGYDRDVRRDVSGILIEGLGGAKYHIYPKDIENSPFPVIDAETIIRRQLATYRY